MFKLQVLALLMSYPTAKLFIAQVVPTVGTPQLVPDLRGLLDFGVTAVVAVGMVWIYSRQVQTWQQHFLDVSKNHGENMVAIVKEYQASSAAALDRYDRLADRLGATIEANMVVKGKLLDAITELTELSRRAK